MTPAARRCTVWFRRSTIAEFFQKDPPTEMGPFWASNRPSPLRLRNPFKPALKGPAHYASARLMDREPDTKSSSRSPSSQLEQPQQEDRGESHQQPWQLIRKRRWWRKERQQGSNSHLPSTIPGQQKFKAWVSGRCFNYVAYDHKRAQCRNPATCWVCKRCVISHQDAKAKQQLEDPTPSKPTLLLLLTPETLHC